MTAVGPFTSHDWGGRYELKRRVLDALGNTLMPIEIGDAQQDLWVRHLETGCAGRIVGVGSRYGELMVQFDMTGKGRHKKRWSIESHLLQCIPEMLALAAVI